MQYHPDRGGNEKDYRKITQAYEILSDPEKRARYDETGQIDTLPNETQKLAARLVEAAFKLSDTPISTIKNKLAEDYQEHLMRKAKAETQCNRMRRRYDKFKKENPHCERVLELIEAAIDKESQELILIDKALQQIHSLREFFDGTMESNESESTKTHYSAWVLT